MPEPQWDAIYRFITAHRTFSQENELSSYLEYLACANKHRQYRDSANILSHSHKRRGHHYQHQQFKFVSEARGSGEQLPFGMAMYCTYTRGELWAGRQAEQRFFANTRNAEWLIGTADLSNKHTHTHINERRQIA